MRERAGVSISGELATQIEQLCKYLVYLPDFSTVDDIILLHRWLWLKMKGLHLPSHLMRCHVVV